MAATEHAGDIVFLYRVEAGPASQSYGIQVAKLAGVPHGVLSAARQKLQSLEAQGLRHDAAGQGDLFNPPDTPPAAPSAVEEQLRALSLDDVSPREALNVLYRLKSLLET